ncbi:hypothetical protein ACQ4LE_000816 [Meloidogyne hapla]
MSPNRGKVKNILSSQQVMGKSELQKSITFHDFCELTQRQLAEFTFNRSHSQREDFTPLRENPHSSIIQHQVEEVDYITRTDSNSSIAENDSFDNNGRILALQDCTIFEEDNIRRKTNGFRKRPFNSTFSAWLQLFLAKRRQRHNRYFASGTHSQQIHQNFCTTFSGPNGGPLRSSVSLSVVHEGATLGSDGESTSPCTSDQSTTSNGACCIDDSLTVAEKTDYVPKVKMRHKLNRRWTEQDIQKRLSLPPDIKLPLNVIDKLNRNPTLENPLTRKSKRASLSEIGFGKLETYKKIFDLGEGTYATVYLGKSLLTGNNVALKEIRLEHEEGAPCTAIREVSLLRNLKHANIVTLHDIVYTDRMLTLVFEFVERDLREYMEELESMISISNVKLFLVQLLRGLTYCHYRRILHRDLKPQNLLINRIGELKLADFGLARAQSVPSKTYSNEVVTLWYRPPDVLLGSTDYSTHIDMWGVGCIFYEMLVHKPMFPGSTTDEQLGLIFQKLGMPSIDIHPELCTLPNFSVMTAHNLRNPQPPKTLLQPPRITPERADLLDKLLQYDGKLRISAIDAMKHQFLECFPPKLFELSDNESVLNLPGVLFIHDRRSDSAVMHK